MWNNITIYKHVRPMCQYLEINRGQIFIDTECIILCWKYMFEGNGWYGEKSIKFLFIEFHSDAPPDDELYVYLFDRLIFKRETDKQHHNLLINCHIYIILKIKTKDSVGHAEYIIDENTDDLSIL